MGFDDFLYYLAGLTLAFAPVACKNNSETNLDNRVSPVVCTRQHSGTPSAATMPARENATSRPDSRLIRLGDGSVLEKIVDAPSGVYAFSCIGKNSCNPRIVYTPARDPTKIVYQVPGVAEPLVVFSGEDKNNGRLFKISQHGIFSTSDGKTLVVGGIEESRPLDKDGKTQRKVAYKVSSFNASSREMKLLGVDGKPIVRSVPVFDGRKDIFEYSVEDTPSGYNDVAYFSLAGILDRGDTKNSSSWGAYVRNLAHNGGTFKADLFGGVSKKVDGLPSELIQKLNFEGTYGRQLQKVLEASKPEGYYGRIDSSDIFGGEGKYYFGFRRMREGEGGPRVVDYGIWLRRAESDSENKINSGDRK